jgi:predicted amidohydrolase YtcJ
MADLVVLDHDFMTVPENEIAAIRPVLTMTGGRIVFERK